MRLKSKFTKNQQIKFIPDRLSTIKNVRITDEDGVTLRIRHLFTQFDPELKKAVVENTQPVVLAHRTHSRSNVFGCEKE